METHLLNFAAAIIQRCDREHAADAVLRSHLKAERGLSQIRSAQVSRAVFAYFRWFGWLEQNQPLPNQIEQALELARRFSNHPLEFSDDDLRERTVPHWLRDYMDITPAWLRAIQPEPKMWLRSRLGQGRAVAAKLQNCRPFGLGALIDVLEYQGDKDLFRTPEFH